ncbi:histidine phosphatase family protein [Ralstonia pseudosolanacearum]|uniref:Histidine phosphatase family protein n=1 Tax=Ralstonia solanacearum TaxID=305 RepID=A0A0S4TQJ9_RALSL|nr:histidine phosphatase family protein [Ralstonia pseudosolanacearum]OAI79266.1 phosphoglycerate mutase [Ralstonia solanacearum]QCX50640.1 histidine phosphatase family protein [Ralstonia pseudosolanacearum]CUV12324.1 Phosphoglycerate mutase 2 protein [Ralstonia solanacearum]
MARTVAMPMPMPQITHIVLVRHGETDWNRERRLQGQLDVPLNAQGREQAAQLGRALAREPFDAIYASDLSRARETAQALAGEIGKAVRDDTGLRERCYGGFEGLTYAEVAERHPVEFEAWQNRVPEFAPPGGGETLAGFHARAVDAALRLIRRHPGERIALVSHGGVLDCLYRHANAMALTEPRQHALRNASINRLSSDGHHLTVLQWGDVAHLDLLVLDEVDRRVP